MSAAGHSVPVLLVFHCTNMKVNLGDAPSGAIAHCDKSGWIQPESFFKWFQELFLKNVNSSKENTVVLDLDGYYSQTPALPDCVRENGVHLFATTLHYS